MIYSKQLNDSQKSNNFVKSLAAQVAVLRVAANLGAVRLSEAARVFRPHDDPWNEEVRVRTRAYLAWLYHHNERAKKQFTPSFAVLETLGAVPDLPRGEAVKLAKSGAPRSLLGTEATQLVELDTGLRENKGAKGKLLVLRLHWIRVRSLAADIADRSALARASRVLERLVADKLLAVNRGENGDRVYTLSVKGANYLGPRYKETKERSLSQSAHRSLANGYLMHSLCEATEGWSEGSLFSPKLLPGVMGTPGFFTHSELFLGTSHQRGTAQAIHPADGVIMKRLATEKNKEKWHIELVEAERGNKPSSDFVKSLYPLRFGKNELSKIEKTFIRNDSQALVREFRITKITYVMSSEEFLSPLLRACRQFITGTKQDPYGEWVKVGTIQFTGSETPSDNLYQTRWEELLSMIEIALCPLSLVKKYFLGVSFKCTLLSWAKEHGMLDYTKVN